VCGATHKTPDEARCAAQRTKHPMKRGVRRNAQNVNLNTRDTKSLKMGDNNKGDKDGGGGDDDDDEESENERGRPSFHYLPSSPNIGAHVRSMTNPPKVAFLFLTITTPTREDLWRGFFNPPSNSGQPLYSIYCHAKNRERVPQQSFLYPHLIEEHIDTSWASISLVYATLLMLKEALKDPQNQRFILVSETCSPIVDFMTAYETVMNQPCSSFSYNPHYISSKDHENRYRRFKNKTLIPPDKFMKAHQWWVMDRRAAELCARGRHAKDFDRVFASDEHYFINMCILYKVPFVNCRRTFVEFDHDRSHPKVFHEISLGFLTELRSKGYLFMRKIRKPTLFLP